MIFLIANRLALNIAKDMLYLALHRKSLANLLESNLNKSPLNCVKYIKYLSVLALKPHITDLSKN